MEALWRLGGGVLNSLFPSNVVLPFENAPATVTSSYNRPETPPYALEALEPFPELPRELVLRIFTFALPPPGYATSSDRYRTLLGYSSLDKDLARWAALELRRHVHLATPRSASYFSDLLNKRPREWSKTVKTLRIGQLDVEEANAYGGDWLYADVGRLVECILSVCPDVEELWIAGAKDLQLHPLSFGANLRKLYLFESRIIPSPPLYLPRLRSLHLKAVICTGSTLEDLLAPSSLPKLDTLDFFSVHQSLVSHPSRPHLQQHERDNPVGASAAAPATNRGPPTLAQLNELFGHLQQPSTPSASSRPRRPPYHDLAPQIRHLSLGPYSTRTLPLSALPLFESLVSLSIPRTLFLSPVVDPSSSFSPTFRALRVTNAMTKSDERERNEATATATGRTREPDRREPGSQLVRDKVARIFAAALENDEIVFAPSERRDAELVEPSGPDRDDSRQATSAGSQTLTCRLVGDDVEFSDRRGRPVLLCDSDSDAISRGEDKDGTWELGQEHWRRSIGVA